MGGALRRNHHLFAEGTVAGLPDGQFVERFLIGGDEAAFAALMDRHGPEFHAFGWIEPAPRDSSLTQDLMVVPGGRGR
jgi:hypothetical protein